MASNEYGRLRILFMAVLLSNDDVEINVIVCVLPLGKPTVNLSIWNMLMFCCSSLCLWILVVLFGNETYSMINKDGDQLAIEYIKECKMAVLYG